MEVSYQAYDRCEDDSRGLELTDDTGAERHSAYLVEVTYRRTWLMLEERF